MRKKNLLLLTLCLSVFSCSACKIQSADPEKGYYSDFAMSAVEYSIFLSKQISVIENVLSTRMAMANEVASGNYSVPAEIQNTQEAISKITAIRDEISVTRPACGLESDTENLLSLIDDTKEILNDYQKALEDGDKDKIKECINNLKDCFLSVSGEANTYY